MPFGVVLTEGAGPTMVQSCSAIRAATTTAAEGGPIAIAAAAASWLVTRNVLLCSSIASCSPMHVLLLLDLLCIPTMARLCALKLECIWACSRHSGQPDVARACATRCSIRLGASGSAAGSTSRLHLRWDCHNGLGYCAAAVWLPHCCYAGAGALAVGSSSSSSKR